jgi:hypothetical protein
MKATNYLLLCAIVAVVVAKVETRRMVYADYAEWLAWAKRGYQMKDRLDADVHEKEYRL